MYLFRLKRRQDPVISLLSKAQWHPTALRAPVLGALPAAFPPPSFRGVPRPSRTLGCSSSGLFAVPPEVMLCVCSLWSVRDTF